jgi:GNAT superfamily N-acetyltransferase
MNIRNPKNREELKQMYDMSKSYTNNHQTWGEFLAKYRKHPDLFLVIYEGTKLIAEAFGYVREDGEGHLHSIAVFGTEWNKGIGTELIHAFERACSKYTSILSVSTKGKPEKFYRKVGYKLQGILAVYENGRKMPQSLDIKPSTKSIRQRDNTRFAFFPTSPEMTKQQIKDLELKLEADDICITFEKRLK